MQAVFVGFAIANLREEFLARFNDVCPGVQARLWSSTPDLAQIYRGRTQAQWVALQLGQSGVDVVEIYDAGDHWRVLWSEQVRRQF